jgi:hypothetical protein
MEDTFRALTEEGISKFGRSGFEIITVAEIGFI